MKTEDQTELVKAMAMMMTLVMPGTTELAGQGEQSMSNATLNMSATDRYQPRAYAHAAGELSDEPRTPEEALERPDAELWRQSMVTEWASLQEKGVLEKDNEVPRWKRVLPMKAVLK